MSILDKVLAVMAPHNCLGCGDEGSLLCKTCLVVLPSVKPKVLDGPDLEFVYSATSYGGIAKDLIWRLKSSGAQEAARIMAAGMLQLLPKDGNIVIVPVPTATTRVRQRGYDQARLLAREISRQSHLPYSNLLVRQGQAHQVGADRAQRIHQLSTAFRVRSRSVVRGAHVVLVDDVVTTGATLEIAVKILKQAGASHITAIAFAQPQLRIKPQFLK